MPLLTCDSRTKFRKIVKSELSKVNGKVIQDVTWREDNMTIHFTDNTHLRLACEISGVSIEALLKGQPTLTEDQFYDQAAELEEMKRLYEKGLDYC